jgi:hypothetical protein
MALENQLIFIISIIVHYRQCDQLHNRSRATPLTSPGWFRRFGAAGSAGLVLLAVRLK